MLPLLARRGWAWCSRPLYWWYGKTLYSRISQGRIPAHIGLILDGNRRFARGIGADVCDGHASGVGKVYELLQWCQQLGIANVTVFAFSNENFQRAQREVEYLFDLFAREIHRLVDDRSLRGNNLRVRVIGQRQRVPSPVLSAIEEVEAATASHDGMLLNIALAYGGRDEITDAVRSLLEDALCKGQSLAQVTHALTPGKLAGYLYTAGVPDPDLIIRTSGEQRLSGFLLWQAAYSEYYFCDALWPAFRRIDFLRAIRNYQNRKRRYGK